MQSVVDSVQRVSAIIATIADASAEQRNGIEQVNDAITQMDQVTQQNAALVEQAAAAANALQDQAEKLAASVRVFRLEAGAGPAPAAGTAARAARQPLRICVAAG
jgi:methyl-accepting chemotaxis protein